MNIVYSVFMENFNNDYIKKMIGIGLYDVFTSLHITEELKSKERLVEYIDKLNSYKLNVIYDISPIVLELFSISELKELKVKMIRIDYGFDLEEIIKLYSDFQIILNASTITSEELEYLNKKIDLSTVKFIHNYYPKEETGLSVEMYNALNEMIYKYSKNVYTFIPGDVKRGPIYKGLPTIEEHRYRSVITNYLNLEKMLNKVIISDLSLNDETIEELLKLLRGEVVLRIENQNLDKKFINTPLNIRRDSNHINIRIEDSRFNLKTEEMIEPQNTIVRTKGSITQDNIKSLRYNGEIMIAKKDIEAKGNLNVVAKISEKYIDLIDYIDYTKKIIFIEEK